MVGKGDLSLGRFHNMQEMKIPWGWIFPTKELSIIHFLVVFDYSKILRVRNRFYNLCLTMEGHLAFVQLSATSCRNFVIRSVGPALHPCRGVSGAWMFKDGPLKLADVTCMRGSYANINRFLRNGKTEAHEF